MNSSQHKPNSWEALNALVGQTVIWKTRPSITGEVLDFQCGYGRPPYLFVRHPECGRYRKTWTLASNWRLATALEALGAQANGANG